jgi:uncharacterized membrane protein YhfC
MTYQINPALYAVSAVQLLFGLAFPAALWIIWRIRTKAKHSSVLFGAVTFVLFALILETLPKLPLYLLKNPVSDYINGHAWAYALIGAALAGIFEEVGRYICFRTVMKKAHDPKEAVAHGIGHGGIECVYILCSVGVTYIIYAVMLQSGTFDTLYAQVPAEYAYQLDDIRTQLTEFRFSAASLLPLLERVFAVAFHIAGSVIVFRAAQRRDKRFWLPVMILLHTLLDIPAALYQKQVLTILPVEIYLALCSAVCCVIACKVYRTMRSEYSAADADPASA